VVEPRFPRLPINPEIRGRRSDIVGIFRKDASALSPAGTLLIEHRAVGASGWSAAVRSQSNRSPRSSGTGASEVREKVVQLHAA
jgi:hypothetical protein